MVDGKFVVVGLLLLVAGIPFALWEKTISFPPDVVLGEIMIGIGCILLVVGFLDLMPSKKT